jgi:hypothetical protein
MFFDWMEKYRRVRCAADWGLRFMTMFVMERVIAPFTSKYSDAWDFENSSPIGMFFPNEKSVISHSRKTSRYSRNDVVCKIDCFASDFPKMGECFCLATRFLRT